jgi:Spy/CpxP family protein refolding chaperone
VKRGPLAFAVLLLAAPLLATQYLPDGKWWKRPRIAAEIGLTPEQTREIDAIFVKSRSRLIDLKAELEKRQAELQDFMEDETADRKAVAQKIDQVENARAELQKARALMFLDMKGVLRPEQWERVKEMQARARQFQEERRRRLRMEEERLDRRNGRVPSPRSDRPAPRE